MRWIISMVGIVVAFIVYLQPVQALNYGANAYGSCQYSTCNITLSSNSSIVANVTPGATTTCTVVGDSVGVQTGASSGYTLSLSDSDEVSTLIGSNGGTVTASSGTPASPVSLQANKWGYRVDGLSGFGAGPTTTGVDMGLPTDAFAGIPPFSAPHAVDSTSVAATEERTSTIYYGLCLNTSIPNGVYSDNITYTAIIN